MFAGSAASPEQFPRDGLPEVAFLGRSNVGKSSLLNVLAGVRNLAKVSSAPGRTRLVNFFRVSGVVKSREARRRTTPGVRRDARASHPTGPNELYLADLPGYGYAKVPEAMRRGWEHLVASYLVGRGALALCVFLVDARHEPTEGDESLRAYLDHHGLPYVVAATKADKLGPGERVRRREALLEGLGRRALGVVMASARTREGVDVLWRTIRDALDTRSRAQKEA